MKLTIERWRLNLVTFLSWISGLLFPLVFYTKGIIQMLIYVSSLFFMFVAWYHYEEGAYDESEKN